MSTQMSPIRTLFCFGLLPAWFEADAATRKQAHDKLYEAFDDLKGRFGVAVLGTMDDDRTLVGPSLGFPWTCYILADVPDYATVARVCHQLSEVQSAGSRLSRYMTVEARMGRELFFGRR